MGQNLKNLTRHREKAFTLSLFWPRKWKNMVVESVHLQTQRESTWGYAPWRSAMNLEVYRFSFHAFLKMGFGRSSFRHGRTSGGQSTYLKNGPKQNFSGTPNSLKMRQKSLKTQWTPEKNRLRRKFFGFLQKIGPPAGSPPAATGLQNASPGTQMPVRKASTFLKHRP